MSSCIIKKENCLTAWMCYFKYWYCMLNDLFNQIILLPPHSRNPVANCRPKGNSSSEITGGTWSCSVIVKKSDTMILFPQLLDCSGIPSCSVHCWCWQSLVLKVHMSCVIATCKRPSNSGQVIVNTSLSSTTHSLNDDCKVANVGKKSTAGI